MNYSYNFNASAEQENDKNIVLSKTRSDLKLPETT